MHTISFIIRFNCRDESVAFLIFGIIIIKCRRCNTPKLYTEPIVLFYEPVTTVTNTDNDFEFFIARTFQYYSIFDISPVISRTPLTRDINLILIFTRNFQTPIRKENIKVQELINHYYFQQYSGPVRYVPTCIPRKRRKNNNGLWKKTFRNWLQISEF